MWSACFFISRRPFSNALSFLAPASSFAINWVDFQNGLFFAVFGSSPLSARAALIIAASALLASTSKVLASAFSPVGFFWAVFAIAARVCPGFTARATAKRLSERQRERLTSFFIEARSLADHKTCVYRTLGLYPAVSLGPDREYQSSMLRSAAPDFTNRNQSAMVERR